MSKKIARGGWSGFGEALIWDPSQMITCHPKKIPKFLLKGGVVQFCPFRQKFFHINGLLKRSILVKLNNLLLFIAKPVLFILFSKIYLLEFSSVESVRAFLNIYMLGF